ncbi:eCIS core domain-containing protein [Lacibacter sp. H407]|uniref:eCIS core domain-containing protein n=1 Tax=Lacibacter sp. H407 TaxID=3133423 RepID=UPI0030BDBB6A
MFSSAEKTTNVHVQRQQQQPGQSFFRKAGEESFFGAKESPSFFSSAIQAKLSVSSPDDPQEKEADTVAEQVMRMPDTVPSIASNDEKDVQRKEEQEEQLQAKQEAPVISIQRKCTDCEKEETAQAKLFRMIQRSEETPSSFDHTNAATDTDYSIDRKELSVYHSDVIQRSGRGPPAGSIQGSFAQNLSSSKGAGTALPSGTKQFMESRFGADFSGVRIHTGSYAENLSSTIHAQAFTHGNDIYFNAGKYSPNTSAGGTLLAHELTHTIQQGASHSHAPTTVATKSVARKQIIQRSATGVPSQLTNAVEKAKTVEGKIDANKPQADGNRTGWEHLVEIFKTTFGEEMIVSGGGSAVKGAVAEQDIKKKREQHGVMVVDTTSKTDRSGMMGTKTGSRDAMPSWCGIFVFWALNKSGVPMPKWKLGERMIKPEAARAPGTMPLPGDIAYRNAFSHFAIVESVNGNTVKTVNGNTAGEDNLGGQVQTKDHPLSEWTAFFDPLLIMTGALGDGETTAVPEVPKTLAELRNEAVLLERKEEPGDEHETNIQAKQELSNWSVDATQGLQTTAQTIQKSEEKNELQKKEEEIKEEEKINAGPVNQVQKKQADEFIHDEAVANKTISTAAAAHGIQTKTDNSSLNQDSEFHDHEMHDAQGRGPPVQMKSNEEEVVQRSVIDDALSYVSTSSLLGCVDITSFNDTSACVLRKARDVAMHIPGYKALRVVLGRDPITGDDVIRNGHNFIEAAFDIMPGGELLHQKLDEQHQLDAAAEWIDGRIADLETIVNDLFSEFDQFWNELELLDLRSPTTVIRNGAAIVLRFINRIIDFAVSAAGELLEMVKQFLLEKIVDFIKEHTNAYPLLTVILGEDPVTKQQVDRNGTNILNALLELGGEEGIQQRTQMQETGTFQKVVDYIDEGIAVFSDLYNSIVQNFSAIWDRVTIDALMNPVDTFRSIYDTFADPINRVLDFVIRVGTEILKLIKEVLMLRLSAWARTVRGYSLITVIIGEDPFTHEAVPFTIENVIKGFFSLMEGGEEQYNQLKETGAIDRTVAKITAAVNRLNMTPAAIIQLFIDLWNSFSIHDLMDPVGAFRRILATFGEPIGRLIAFVITIVKIVIEAILIVMNFPFDLINNIITRAMAAFDRIKRDPVAFLKNLLRAIKQGFIQFFDNILQHLIQGLVGWLMSELRDAGVPELSDLSLRGVIAWVLEVLGISMEKIWEKLAAHPRIGPQRVARIRGMINTLDGIWTFIKDVQERGMAAIWDKIQEQLSNLWNTILDAVKNWVMEQIINRMVARLLSMLDPTGIMAVVNSAIAIYSAIQSFIKYLREMLEVVNSFVNGVAEIAEGNITTAANYLERTMARAMPVVIGFLANQVGLSGIGRRVGEMIERAREMVDEALTWLVNRAVDTGMNLLDRVMGRAEPAAPDSARVRSFPDADEAVPFMMGDEHHELRWTSRGGVIEITMSSDLRILLPLYLSRAIEQLNEMPSFQGKPRIRRNLDHALRQVDDNAIDRYIEDWNTSQVGGTRARSQPEFIREKLLRAVEPLQDLSVGDRKIPAIVGLFDLLNKNTSMPGPYSSIADPTNVAPFNDFTTSQKRAVLNANMTNHGGQLVSDCNPSEVLHDNDPNDSLKANVDHIYPRAKGGSNSYSNAQVISRADNLRKSDTMEGCP